MSYHDAFIEETANALLNDSNSTVVQDALIAIATSETAKNSLNTISSNKFATFMQQPVFVNNWVHIDNGTIAYFIGTLILTAILYKICMLFIQSKTQVWLGTIGTLILIKTFHYVFGILEILPREKFINTLTDYAFSFIAATLALSGIILSIIIAVVALIAFGIYYAIKTIL